MIPVSNPISLFELSILQSATGRVDWETRLKGAVVVSAALDNEKAVALKAICTKSFGSKCGIAKSSSEVEKYRVVIPREKLNPYSYTPSNEAIAQQGVNSVVHARINLPPLPVGKADTDFAKEYILRNLHTPEFNTDIRFLPLYDKGTSITSIMHLGSDQYQIKIEDPQSMYVWHGINSITGQDEINITKNVFVAGEEIRKWAAACKQKYYSS